MKHAIPIITLLLLLTSCSSLRAQGEGEQPVRKRKTSGGIVGIGGGVTFSWYFLNTKELNAELALRAFPALSEDGLFFMGGHGHAYIIFIPNVRIGGMGAGGTLETTSTSNGVSRSTKLSTSFGGVTLDYVIQFGRFHIALGGLVGMGRNTLALTMASDGAKDWAEIFLPPAPNDAAGYRHEMTQSFFTYQPALTIEYDISPFIVLGLSGGYFGVSGDSWELNEAFPLRNVPDFKFSSPFVRAVLTVGLFIGE